MIIDSIECLSRYSLLLPNYSILSEFLIQKNINSLELGKHKILNDNVYININEYFTNNKENTLWEAHNQYIDIHIVLNGEEDIGYIDHKVLIEKESYNYEQDVTIYSDNDLGKYFTLSSGLFCVFFSNECHKPGCITMKKEFVKKAVIKIKL